MIHSPTSISGDLPSNEFEAGHAVGGDYSCLCGVNINVLPSADDLFTTGPYTTIDERLDALGSVILPMASLDKMKVRRIEQRNKFIA